MVEVIDNGSDAPGTILPDCSRAFRKRFAAADLIIAKGQGNYETLSDEPAPAWFLFKVKCPVIAACSGQGLEAHVLMKSQAAQVVGHDRGGATWVPSPSATMKLSA